MLRSLAVPFATLGLLVAGLAAAPAVLAGDPCFHSLENRPPSSTGATTTIAIADCTFGPTVNHVPVGAEVVWRNASSQAHEVVGANLEWGAHDKLIEPGDSMGWTFEEAGVYAYSCMLHPGMTGAIVVGDGLPADARRDDPNADAADTSPVVERSEVADTPPAALAAVGGAAALLGAVAIAVLLLGRRRVS